MKKASHKTDNLPLYLKNFFTKDTRSLKKKSDLKNRKNYLEKIYSIYVNDAIFISTTGKTSKLYFINKKSKNNAKIFYTIGGMGHASSIAIGLGMIKDKKIVILDGDGSLLMHMGILPIIGDQSLGNLYHLFLIIRLMNLLEINQLLQTK